MTKRIILIAILMIFSVGNAIAQLLPTEMPKDLSKSETRGVIKYKTEAILEPAYLKAENNLPKAKMGMSSWEFIGTMGANDISNSQGKLLAVTINGLLMRRDYRGKHGEQIREYIFGYVKNSIMITRFSAKFVDDKLVEINRFKKDYLEEEEYIGQMNRIDRKRLQKIDINEDRYNMERFLKAKERIKNVTLGMSIMEFLNIMEGYYVLVQVGEDYFILMDGYLNFIGDYNFDFETEEGYKSVWPFGYMENGAEIPKFFVVTINDEVKNIIFDTDKEEFDRLVRYKEKNR